MKEQVEVERGGEGEGKGGGGVGRQERVPREGEEKEVGKRVLFLSCPFYRVPSTTNTGSLSGPLFVI